MKKANKTKWLTVYITILAIRAVIGILFVLSNPSYIRKTVSGFLSLIEFAIEIYLFINLKQRKKIAYHINKIALIALPIYLLICQSFAQGIIYGTIFSVIVALAWCLPNFIYFKNREFLFIN